jgi:hypothetical protein
MGRWSRADLEEALDHHGAVALESPRSGDRRCHAQQGIPAGFDHFESHDLKVTRRLCGRDDSNL